MKTLKILLISLFTFLMFYSFANSEDYSSSKPLHCSVNRVNECVASGGCESIDPFVANIPYFLTVDLASKTISSTSTVGEGRSTPIERIETIDELITLSGAEPKSKGDKDKFGWIMTISVETGQMIMSAITNSSALVIFGSCID